MIYLVTGKQQLFNNPNYTIISVKESLEMMKDWSIIQVDSETTGKLKILEYLRTFIRL